MGEREIMEVLQREPETWHTAQEICLFTGASNQNRVYKYLKRMSKFGLIETTDVFLKDLSKEKRFYRAKNG